MRWIKRQRWEWETIQKGEYVYSVFGSVPIPILIMKSHSQLQHLGSWGCLSVWNSLIGFCFWTQIQ